MEPTELLLPLAELADSIVNIIALAGADGADRIVVVLGVGARCQRNCCNPRCRRSLPTELLLPSPALDGANGIVVALGGARRQNCE